jgi:hypothetical protein
MEFDPPLHVIHDDRGVLTVRFEREAFVRFLPLAFQQRGRASTQPTTVS